jgi:hypothetical protein
MTYSVKYQLQTTLHLITSCFTGAFKKNENLLLASLYLSVSFVFVWNTSAPNKEFPWNLILGSFNKIRQTNLISVKIAK